MRGKISIKEQKIQCIIGCLPEERQTEQEIRVDLSMDVGLADSARSDSLDDTIDYSQVAELCRQVAQEGRYQLLEAYAYAALQTLFQRFPVERAEISVKKPGAIPSAEWASVSLSVDREEMLR